MLKKISGPEIERMIHLLSRLPGLGPRSARRAALQLIKKREQLLVPLASAMKDVADKVQVCSQCLNVDTFDPCSICSDSQRDPGILVIVEDVMDLWALERANIVNARYHVLGGVLSPLDGIGPDQLAIPQLMDRATEGKFSEIILAVNATLEGQSTAYYLTSLLSHTGAKVTRLAYGVPVGGELDYLDEGTLAAALQARTIF